MKLGNIIFQTLILSAWSLFLKIEWSVRNAAGNPILNHIITPTRIIRIIIHIHIITLTTIPIAVIGGNRNNDGETWLTALNYSLLSWAIVCNILEMAEMETPNNRVTFAKDIPNSFTNRSPISEEAGRFEQLA